jgi:hypothetical protein
MSFFGYSKFLCGKIVSLHDIIFQPLPAARLKVNAAETCLLFSQWLEICAFEIRSVAGEPVFAAGVMSGMSYEWTSEVSYTGTYPFGSQSVHIKASDSFMLPY